jgi:Tfp pilus assembly protein PilX
MTLLLGMGLMSTTGFLMARGQFQLVSNLQFQELSFNEAEGALAEAEDWLSQPGNAQNAAFTTHTNRKPGLYPLGKMAQLQLDVKTMNWTNSNSMTADTGRYVVEQIADSVRLPGSSLQMGQASTGACRAVDLFRVVARSAATRGASRMIETHFAADAC